MPTCCAWCNSKKMLAPWRTRYDRKATKKLIIFSTATVYEKGAEVVRMLHTLLGEKTFKRASNHYFEKFDGQAVTTDDFLDIMQQTSGIDLSQFRLWYDQAGTPEVQMTSHYDADNQSLRLDFEQHIPNTPGEKKKSPMLIPIRTALFNLSGERMAFSVMGEQQTETVLHLSDAQQSIVLNELESPTRVIGITQL